MSTPLKFEFDFDEVFEGIKLGVIKQLSETSFEAATNRAINEVKAEINRKMSLTYTDEREIKNEIREEIKDKVYKSVIADIKAEYKKSYANIFDRDVTHALNSAEKEIAEDVKNKTVKRLYDDLYSHIEARIRNDVNKAISQIVNSITGNGVKVIGSTTELSKDEYKRLVERDEILEALEQGGVDNWQWYGESLRDYFGEEDE